MIYMIFAILTSDIINLGYSYMLIFLLIVLLRQKNLYGEIRMNFLYSKSFLLLMGACATYVLIGERTSYAFYHYIMLPAMAFAIGWCIAESRKENEVIDIILAIVAGFTFHATLNAVVNFGNSNRYALVDVWTGSFRAATGSGLLNTPTVSVFWYMVLLEKRKKVKIVYFVLLLFSVYYMFLLGTRTQFLILMILSIFVATSFQYRRDGIQGVLRLTIIIVVSVFAVFLIYKTDLFKLQEKLMNTNLILRFSKVDSLARSDEFRIESFWAGLKDLFVFPFGGRKSQKYRHNMWLDVGRVSGIIPFLLLLLYSIRCIMKVWRIYRSCKISNKLRFLLMIIYLGCYINCFVEPIWEGGRNFFLSMCLFDGIVCQIEKELQCEQSSRTDFTNISRIYAHM